MTTFNRPPVQVMMDAWAFGKSVVMHFPIDGKSSEYYMALYFQELNGTSGLRKFSLLLNGELLQEISPQANGFGFIAVKSISGTFANFTLQSAPSSVSNPILNGIEMYGLLDVNSSSTDPDDVRFLNAIRARLGLVESIGDPCFPVPWGWLSCSHLQPSRVTQLKLSNSGLGGSIPLELVSLTELTDLWLDSNNFKGLIPNFSSLQKIRTIYLQNNNLTGPIPSNLSELPLLQELFLDNNTLYGVVPQSLLALDSSNDRNFTFTFSGNLLCLPGNKTCEENSPGSGSSTSNSSSFNKGLIFGPSVGGLAVLMAIIAAVLMYYRRGMKETIAQTANSKKEYTKQALDMGQTNQARPYTYEEIERITCNFHNVLGAGSFGPVYHGKLSSGQEVAVKVNAANSNQGQAEFVNEVVLLSRVHHKYLVSLVGYCEDSNQQILIYVYMPNGSLGDHLHHKKPGKKPLSWRKRLEIALNAAQGLDYLHTFCSPPIIHRDVKPNNILLDENLNAKVADFGMSKSEFEGSQTGISTAVKGTLGYLDPEYSSGRQRLNQKSDVYSFGVVLLELITGKKPTSSQPVDGGSDIHMIEWTRLVKTHGDISVIIDPAMGSDYKVEAVWKLAELGWTSISERGADRPDMGRIVQGLVEAIQIEGTNVIQNLVKPKIKKVAFEDESTESTEAPLRTHSMNTVGTWDSKNSSAYNPR
ncbi:hypothetical protein Mapa_001742 [Marchantia paleacea]|nr:hypothetical protein Mapa_001742 [Marchantia paleacea]